MSSPSCHTCKNTLYMYRCPDNENSLLGFLCTKCVFEWFLECHVHGTNGHTITHNEVVYYQTQPRLLRKPTLIGVGNIADLQIGDQLVWNKIYDHHAIVSDVNESSYKVIHFAPGDGAKKGGIRQDHYNDLDREVVKVAKFDSQLIYDPIVIISRTNLMYDHRENIKYNLLSFNCESFANFCSTGVIKSFQICNAAAIATSALSASSVALPFC